jgi:anti-sigma factor RsiW
VTQDMQVGGLRCSEVLVRLSDYLDGELPQEERAQVEAHLRGCAACARFGGEVGIVLRALRAAVLADAPPSERIRERLARALRATP